MGIPSKLIAGDTVKTHKLYKGVKIFKTKEEFPNLHEQKNGKLIERKPIIEYSYQFKDSYPYDSLQDCKDGIDRIYEKMKDDVDDKEFAMLMNEA